MKEFPLWADWIDHPDPGAYWAPYDIEKQHAQVDVPASQTVSIHSTCGQVVVPQVVS